MRSRRRRAARSSLAVHKIVQIKSKNDERRTTTNNDAVPSKIKKQHQQCAAPTWPSSHSTVGPKPTTTDRRPTEEALQRKQQARFQRTKKYDSPQTKWTRPPQQSSPTKKEMTTTAIKPPRHRSQTNNTGPVAARRSRRATRAHRACPTQPRINKRSSKNEIKNTKEMRALEKKDLPSYRRQQQKLGRERRLRTHKENHKSGYCRTLQ